MATAHSNSELVYHPMQLPIRHTVETRAPIRWLSAGWRYFQQARGLSLAYGAFFAAVGMLITWLGLNRPQFILTFWSGFLLVGPLLAIGLYRIAQLQDADDTVSLATCWQRVRERLGQVALFSLLLSLIMVAWIRFSTLAAALYVGNITGSSSFIAAMGTADGVGFVVLLFGVGAVFAAIMFAITAWSLPMMLDSRADFGTALVTSVKATIEQPMPMLIWGASVASLTVLGMLTLFVGFVVIFPLLGYATWAAYRELFAND